MDCEYAGASKKLRSSYHEDLFTAALRPFSYNTFQHAIAGKARVSQVLYRLAHCHNITGKWNRAIVNVIGYDAFLVDAVVSCAFSTVSSCQAY